MGRKAKPVALGNIPLQLLYRIILKLDNGITAGADQMVMMLTHQLMLIAGLPVRQHHLTGQTSLHKQLQGTINRGLPNTGMGCLHLQIQLFNT